MTDNKPSKDNTIRRLFANGQSAWCDNISRAMLNEGELQRLVDLGIVGVTSNPSIFMKAITGSTQYDDLFGRLLQDGLDLMGIYEGLVIPDIADAADLLKDVYDQTDGVDGYVSLEVSPKLAYDTDATVVEGRRLAAALNRPNVLIKVPATDEGYPAIETLIAEGISINVTLIFSRSAHEHVMQAYIKGLERYADSGGDVSKVASVASFFVSRVDTVVDRMLIDLGADASAPPGASSTSTIGANPTALLGRTAIANARLAYQRAEEVFSPNGDFAALAARGARAQRPLWASTSTKNPSYPDTLYVDQLVGPGTVNTIPPATIEAALDHGQSDVTIRDDLDEARQLLDEIARRGIDLDEISTTLRTDGVRLFAEAFDQLLAALESKADQLRAVS